MLAFWTSLICGTQGRSTQLPCDVEFQAVIDAAQPALLVAAEEQRRGAMRAALVEQADAAVGVAEQHQVLAQEPHAHRRRVRLGDLMGERRRNPIAAHQFAHRRAGADAGEQFVFFLARARARSIDCRLISSGISEAYSRAEPDFIAIRPSGPSSAPAIVRPFRATAVGRAVDLVDEGGDLLAAHRFVGERGLFDIGLERRILHGRVEAIAQRLRRWLAGTSGGAATGRSMTSQPNTSRITWRSCSDLA